jgi:hypothetical protein
MTAVIEASGSQGYAMSRLSGNSYDEMKPLIIENHGIPYVFSCELLIAIFWEEPLCNNKEQLCVAWGFVQVAAVNLPPKRCALL